MPSRFFGVGEGLLTTIAGAALLAAESFDMVSRVVGLLAVVLGLIYSTARFLWEIEDRRERKRPTPSTGSPRIYTPEPADPR